MGDIINQVEGLDPERRRRAYEIIVEEEMKGCDRMLLRKDLTEAYKLSILLTDR